MTAKLLTFLEVVKYDLEDVATNLGRGSLDEAGALEALALMLSNHAEYVKALANAGV